MANPTTRFALPLLVVAISMVAISVTPAQQPAPQQTSAQNSPAPKSVQGDSTDQPTSESLADESSVLSADQLEFFESRVRPLLIEHCLECHSAETEASGGLLLDSRPNWQRGGDNGAAIVSREPDASLLVRAIEYDDPMLQMPPEGKLSAAAIADLKRWIAMGAPDPRNEVSEKPSASRALSVADAQQHWAYRPLSRAKRPSQVAAPETASTTNAATGNAQQRSDLSGAIDEWIQLRLDQEGLKAAPPVNRAQWLRRVTFDLHGLPPTAEELDRFLADTSPDAEARWVDRLLASPRFGETFARHWMDVARYAESITLRGFVLPDAWRYRDYLIEAYNEDRPLDEMIVEQIAGDLLPTDDPKQRERQIVATSFLALGNTNLEEQDKTQLEMDHIDEQLEVLGRAFLGQTIGCARCHDHKFDPIPTSDYYAMAGIFRSTVAMEHANVSKWIEVPLPLDPTSTAEYESLEKQLRETKDQLAQLKKPKSAPAKSVALDTLEGIVVDDVDAKLIGHWTESTTAAGFVGKHYLHDARSDRGAKSATFQPKNFVPSEYEVRMSYTTGENRATNAKVVVFSADGEKTLYINQRNAPEDGIWVSLGTYRFEKDGQAFVIVSNDQADGHVVVDAIQFLPTGLVTAAAGQSPKQVAAPENVSVAPTVQELEKQVAELQKQLDRRPKAISIRERLPAKDIAIQIRGNVHSPGAVVPRGVLTAVPVEMSQPLEFDESSSGRLQLAKWLSHPTNPLTARVYANRVWHWLIGQGIVPTTSNFGTTGASPSHPELLDALAESLIHSGWSTKTLVRGIVLSDTYRRSVVDGDSHVLQRDPNNQLLWRGNVRRVTVEAMRDAMLQVSGELDLAMGGVLLKPGVKEDYNYVHQSSRRSLYHPVLRNALPELFDAFDFADTSVSIGERSRSTVAPQSLLMLNHPWVVARARAAAESVAREVSSAELAVEHLYRACFGRAASDEERARCVAFLLASDSSSDAGDGSRALDVGRLTALTQTLFASLDFRYLE